MLFHAQALLRHGVEVDLIGLPGAPLPSAIAADPRIAVRWLRGADDQVGNARRWSFTRAVLRGIGLVAGLGAALLWKTRRPEIILVQNPPGVPALVLAWVAARVRRARLVVDWHNFTHSMLALRFGRDGVVVRLVSAYERYVGRLADANVFVSAAMAQRLRAARVEGVVFRDRPAEIFVPVSGVDRVAERARLFARFDLGVHETTALLVSPTSWTADEDFGILLDALQQYDRRISPSAGSADRLPPIAILVTGNGPLKSAFEEQIAGLRLGHVRIRTAWLEADGYPRALAASDLGLCMHASASGLDLPMKVADMFGAHVPVIAYDYGPCLREIVRPGSNGLLFTTADELCDRLVEALAGFGVTPTLRRLQEGTEQDAQLRWQEAWHRELSGLFLDAMRPAPPR
jgi:beta-1,4-mannosyltransferase